MDHNLSWILWLFISVWQLVEFILFIQELGILDNINSSALNFIKM